jgi:hypothetical protein
VTGFGATVRLGRFAPLVEFPSAGQQMVQVWQNPRSQTVILCQLVFGINDHL